MRRLAALAALVLVASGAGSAVAHRFAETHPQGVLSVAGLAPDHLAISSGVDAVARLWDVRSGQVAKRFSGPEYRFSSISLSADGVFALTPTGDGARYWEVRTGKESARLTGAGGAMHAVALSPDGRLAAAAGQDGGIHIWELASGRHVGRYGQGAAVIGISFSSGAAGFLSVADDGQVCRWMVRSPKPEYCDSAGDEPVSQTAFAPDRKKLLVGGRYGQLILWDLERRRKIREFAGAEGDVVAIEFSPDGALALSGGADKTVRLWDVATGSQKASTQGSGAYVSCVAFVGSGMALFGSADGSIASWDFR
jgi:WD40 repeat protein